MVESMMIRARHFVVPGAVLIGGLAAWSFFTGSRFFWPPLGILVVTAVVTSLLCLHVGSNLVSRTIVGAIVGIAVAEATAYVLITGDGPGSDAVVVYGIVGVMIGSAVGLAAGASAATRR